MLTDPSSLANKDMQSKERVLGRFRNIFRVSEPEPPRAVLFGSSRSRNRKNYEVSAPAPLKMKTNKIVIFQVLEVRQALYEL